jgi:two-component system NtrC family sensor kinase
MESKKYPKKIRHLFFARLVMIPVIMLLLVCAAIVFYFTFYSGKEVKSRHIIIATDHRDMIDSFLRVKSAALKFIIRDNDYRHLSKVENLKNVFNNIQKESQAFVDLGAFDSEGNHVSYVGPYDLIGKNYKTEKWFKKVKQTGFYISDEFLGYRQRPHFIIAAKKNENGNPWYLRATIDSRFFSSLVTDIRIGRTGHAYIINRSGVLQQMQREDNSLNIDKHLDNLKTNPASKAVTFFSGGITGKKYLYCAVPLKVTDWTLVVKQETLDAYFPLFMAALISVLIIICGGSLVIVTGYIMASNMAHRLKIADAEKKEMRTQLIIAGKLAEVGEMSTGIAHEVNNPLQIIKSETAMMDESLNEIEKYSSEEIKPETEILKDCLEQIKIQVTRCGNITRGLLTFARKTEGNFEEFSLEKIIPEIISLVDEKARVENIKIFQEIEKDLPLMISDPGQLQQVILNLLNNSIYALKDRAYKEIRVKAEQISSDVVLTVTDTGCGFKKEEMEKAFVPFFTTKPPGQGTGLGLSTVYGIVKGLGGDMELNSSYNEGSEFKITLPLNSAENNKSEK